MVLIFKVIVMIIFSTSLCYLVSPYDLSSFIKGGIVLGLITLVDYIINVYIEN